jgi:hypothetical protein
MNAVLEAQEEAFTSIKAFFAKEPGEGAFIGCILLFGDNFDNGVGMGDLNVLVGEAGDQEHQAVMRIAANIQVMADVPDLMDQYNQLILLFNTITNQCVEREDQTRDVSRKTRIFMTELNNLKREMEDTPEEDLSLSVIKDYLDQTGDLRKKVSNIRALDDNEIPVEPVRATEYAADGVRVDLVYTVDEWLGTSRRRLLLMKDDEEKSRRRTENREKMMIQETLKSIPRNKIIPLDSRRVFLPWYASYEDLKTSIKTASSQTCQGKSQNTSGQ